MVFGLVQRCVFISTHRALPIKCTLISILSLRIDIQRISRTIMRTLLRNIRHNHLLCAYPQGRFGLTNPSTCLQITRPTHFYSHFTFEKSVREAIIAVSLHCSAQRVPICERDPVEGLHEIWCRHLHSGRVFGGNIVTWFRHGPKAWEGHETWYEEEESLTSSTNKQIAMTPAMSVVLVERTHVLRYLLSSSSNDDGILT